jgi:hypothetical protein
MCRVIHRPLVNRSVFQTATGQSTLTYLDVARLKVREENRVSWVFVLPSILDCTRGWLDRLPPTGITEVFETNSAVSPSVLDCNILHLSLPLNAAPCGKLGHEAASRPSPKLYELEIFIDISFSQCFSETELFSVTSKDSGSQPS